MHIRRLVLATACVPIMVLAAAVADEDPLEDRVFLLEEIHRDQKCSPATGPTGTPPTSVILEGGSTTTGTTLEECTEHCTSALDEANEAKCPPLSELAGTAVPGGCATEPNVTCYSGQSKLKIIVYPLASTGTPTFDCTWTLTDPNAYPEPKGTCAAAWSKECLYDSDSPQEKWTDWVPDCLPGVS